MSATNKSSNYGLPLFIDTDKPSWLGDWNSAMTTIDSSVKTVSVAADEAGTKADGATTTAETAVTTANNALTAAGEAKTSATGATAIANNAYTLAGDAQTDAHASLAASNKNAADIKTVNDKLSVTVYDFSPDTGATNGMYLFYSDFIAKFNIGLSALSLSSLKKHVVTGGNNLLSFNVYNGNPLNLKVIVSNSAQNALFLGSFGARAKVSSGTVSIFFYQVYLWWDGSNSHVGIYATDADVSSVTDFYLFTQAVILPGGILIPPSDIPVNLADVGMLNAPMSINNL